MSSSAVLPSVLSSLPQRPPTPPREAHHEVASVIKPSLGALDTPSSLHTPPGIQSPASTTASTLRRTQKRVGFSAKAEYKEPPVYHDGDGAKQHPTPVSLPRSASKPVKSILKVTTQASNLLGPIAGPDCDLPKPQVNLAIMLESTLQQLAGGDRDSKLDAYLMMTRAWKASNNLPDRVALQDKMGLFTQFIQRDIALKTAEGNLDTSLVNHALTLLNTFLHFPAIASTISNDFGVFIIDHCIRCFEDSSTPKDTARRLMQVVSLQNFPPKVMTSDRVGRLVSSLHNVEEHLQGKSIVLSRVLSYRTLVRQTRQLMVAHSDWLLDMFTDMLSNVKDIRSAAIALGLEAAFTIGHERQLSRRVMEVFNLSYEDRRYIQYYEEKLKAMSKDRLESAIVPEIWSVVILLLRIRLDTWEFAGPWLHVIQNCFNSTDFSTKIAANRAWGRLVYLMHLEERAIPKNLATLTTPLISQLRRKGSGRTSEELRRAVLGGICNLFYYAFKPNTPSTLLNTYWDASVRPVIAKLLDPKAEATEDNLRQASAILQGLFDCTTPRIWRVDHIVESSLVKPEELPAIDSKWIRHNTRRVFGAVEPILELDFLSLARRDSETHRLWHTLVTTIASAASKEIKVSGDTALFVSEALGVFDKIWRRGVVDEAAAQHAEDFLVAARSFLEIMITSLGPLPFTEKTGKHPAPVKAPLYALFSSLSTLPPGVSDDEDFAAFFRSVFGPFFASKSDKAKMDLAHELMSIVPMETPRPYGTWLLVSENILGWLGPGHHSHHSTVSAGETPVGHDYRDIVKVLERGIRSAPNLPSEHWESLFYATFERIHEETGDAGAAIVVIEPLSKILAEQLTNLTSVENNAGCVKYVTDLVSVATQPRDRQAVDAARKRLWGTVLAGSRSPSFDTFDSLYKAVNEVLGCLYSTLDPIGPDLAVQLLREIGGFFDRCNHQLFLRAMTSLQDGLLLWVQDSKRLLGGQTSAVLATVKSVWDKLSNLIAGIDHPEQQLQCLEQFFCASFASCHRTIVNSATSLWNRLFQNFGQLEYPDELKAALVQLQLHADIVLPGLETSSVEYAGQGPSFMDSFEDLSFPHSPSTRSNSRRETPRPTSARSKSPASVKLVNRQLEKLPQKRPVSASRPTPTPRLRHDDSQIQFAAIEPSSALESPIESQVLTERQREIRERQRKNVALFSDVRSSPGSRANDPDLQMLPRGSRGRQAATPEPERAFDDYVSSTPTPRRGLPLTMMELDNNDPPSSPPEPRGNPLAAEIRARSVSANRNMFDDYHMSSSPVSGSPNPTRHGVVVDPSSQRGYVSIVSLPRVKEEGAYIPSSPVKGEDPAESAVAIDDIIEDSMIFEPAKWAPAPVSSGPMLSEVPSTPRRSARLSQARSQETPTPRSDGEDFVDAPTSPIPPSPTRLHRATETNKAEDTKEPHVAPMNTKSFDMSDVDETGLLKLVVELDAGKADRSEYHRFSPSVSPNLKRKPSPVADCIVVKESPKKVEQRTPSRKTRASSAASTVSSAAGSQSIPGSQRKRRVGRPKRKGTPSKVEQGSPKRQRKEYAEEVTDMVNNQEFPAQDVSVEVHASVDAPAVVVEEFATAESHEERIPSSSAEPSSSQHAAQEGKPQESAVYEARDAMEVEDNDEDVQSQIALEISNSQRHEEDVTPTSDELSPVPDSPEEPVQVEIQQIITDVPEEDNITTNVEEVATEVNETAAPAAEVEVAPEVDQMQKIMDLFRSGLDELRSARLSREQVYQIEDILLDVRGGLIEAERRGRA